MSEERAYKVAFDDRPEYYFAELTADHTDKATAPRYLTEITDACRGAGHERLLIERHIVEGTSTTLVVLESGFMDQIGKGLRIAIVEKDEKQFIHLERGIRFSQPGSVNIRPFQTFEEAEKWLCNKQ